MVKRNINIALFASGTGTNVENIYNFFAKNEQINVCCVLCNKPDAYVLTRARELNLDFLLFNRSEFDKNGSVDTFLEEQNVDFIVLAGFLWLIPEWLIRKFTNKIVNVHPALLPKYGGKGMFGDNVHHAVFNNHETESGITIHFVNEKYDDGSIIYQHKVKLDDLDTPDSIAAKVHELEYKYFPTIIEKIALNLQ